MFNQKSVKWSFLITSILVLAACGEVGPSPSLSASSASSSSPNSISQSSNSSSSSSSSFFSSSIATSTSSSSSASNSSSTPPSSSSISSSSSSSQPPVQYTITFKNYDDSVLSTQTVNQGSTVVYSGPTPTRPSTSQYTYTFTGWDKNLTNVTSSFSTIAQYSSTINSYTIIWQNHDGTVLETDNNVPYGTTPTYDGATPTKTGDAQFSYSFTGWSPTIASVTSNNTYTAQFAQSTNTYTVTWQNHDGTVLETDTNVSYGTTPTYNQSNPTKTSTIDYDYSFTGWLPAVSLVTENITYVAQFTENPNYIPITSPEELSNIRNNLSGNYRLMNDIDLESMEWTPIGTANTPFSGKLFGNGYTINNLSITQTHSLIGLFAKNSGVITNLKISNVEITVTGINSVTTYMGSLAGENIGLIDGIETLNGSISLSLGVANNSYVGGIVGLNNRDTHLYRLINGIDVSGINTSAAGGLIGIIVDGRGFYNSINKGNVIGPTYVGGLAGRVNSVVTNFNCINQGNISGGLYAGGLFGRLNRNATINTSLNNGTINGSSAVGGLIGQGHGFTDIINSFNLGNVSGSNNIGGLIGYEFLKITIHNSFNGGIVTGSNTLGGLIGGGPAGSTTQFYVFRSININDVIAPTNITAIGGITGYVPSTRGFEQIYHYGSITSNGVEVAGTDFGTKVTDISTFNLAFFTTTLEWDTEIWDFTGLNIANGVYPTLKNMPVVEE